MAKAISSVTGVPLPTVKVAMRFQREAGFMTQGAHGRHAPDMTPLDAAYTLLILLADPTPGTRAGEIASEIGSMQVSDNENSHEFSIEFLRSLEPPFTLAEALAALIEIYAFDRDKPQYEAASSLMMDGSTLPPKCLVEVITEGEESGASIHIGKRQEESTGVYHFQGKLTTGWASVNPPLSIATHRWISEANIIPLADAFAGRAAK